MPKLVSDSSRRSYFERLYEEHVDAVFAYARRRTDLATAEDVTAEVFAVAWRRLDDIPDHAPLAWLYGAARRVLANEFRSQRRRAALAEQVARNASVAHGTADEDGKRVLDALASLEPGEREVLMLAAWEGLDSRDGGKALGCSATAFRIRLHRARGKLSQRMAIDEWARPPLNLKARIEEVR